MSFKNEHFDERYHKWVLKVYYEFIGDFEKDEWASSVVGRDSSWGGCGTCGMRDLGFLFDTKEEMTRAKNDLATYDFYHFIPFCGMSN